MRIRSLLTPEMEVVSLPTTASVLDATRLMVETHRGSVLVTGEGDEPAGIFTERDLMVRVIAKGLTPAEVTLGEVMTVDLYTVPPDRHVTNVRREMRERHIRHVPVIDSGRVLAVLSVRDLMRADLEETRHDAEALREYIQGEG